MPAVAVAKEKTNRILTASCGLSVNVPRTFIKKGTTGLVKAPLNSIAELIGQKTTKEKVTRKIKKTLVIGSNNFPERVTSLLWSSHKLDRLGISSFGVINN